MHMPKVIVDGVETEVPNGATLLQEAAEWRPANCCLLLACAAAAAAVHPRSLWARQL